MHVISHRGYWLTESERNTAIAFRRSFDLGFGIETDIRDANGKLVISHNLPDGHEMEVSELLDMLDGRDLPVAFNIKADGLSDALRQSIENSQLRHWFTFDMSVPELLTQIQRGFPTYSRCSEYEYPPACYESVAGIWLDSFHRDWFEVALVEKFLHEGKKVCIVSPELHGRNQGALWATLRNSRISANEELMLCTDLPLEAAKWFRGISQ